MPNLDLDVDFHLFVWFCEKIYEALKVQWSRHNYGSVSLERKNMNQYPLASFNVKTNKKDKSNEWLKKGN